MSGQPGLLSPGWTARTGLDTVVAALNADDCRFVGGCVRDAMLGLVPADIDIATIHRPEEVMTRLAEAGIRTVPTGLSHGTVSAILPDGAVEITTLRCDVATDGRHARIAFATRWQDDAARRDFTINALYAHPETLAIDDYFGGLADLAARRVRFIGEAEARIREDHLRILRFFRFQARFGSEPADAQAEAACRTLAPTLKGLSRERVAGELLAILDLPDPAPTVASMARLGVLQVILPETGEAQVAALASLIDAESREGAAPSAERRLAALLPPDMAIARDVASRLRLSNAQRKRIAVAAGSGHDDAADPRALAFRVGMEGARDRLLLAGAALAPLKDWSVPRLPISGGDIVAAGIGEGPRISQTLRRIESRWVAEGFPDEARVRQILAEEIAR